jgi:tryptophan halogenase
MSTDVNKIVIVGGGSSGWIVASTLSRYHQNKEIVVIESPNIPTIGVGESTTAYMKTFINGHLGIEDKEFMPGVDAIYKMSVKFKDWLEKDDEGFHYPFGGGFFANQDIKYSSWILKKIFQQNISNSDFAKSFVPAMALIENNKLTLRNNGDFDNFNPKIDLGYHLNANKLGEWLKNNYCLPRGVSHIPAEVIDVKKENKHILSLTLDNGEDISADLFIDCTGFKSLLLGEHFRPKFISFNDELLNDSAWATPIQYKDKNVEMRPYTTCTALSSGWSWHTPVWSRIGTGYTYSSKHISKEDALQEFKDFISSEKFPTRVSKDEVDKLPFFHINAKVGFYEKSWVNNVVAIGLSSGFLEPLEGTGLLFVHDPAILLSKILGRGKVTQFARDLYNGVQKETFIKWKDFLKMFYYLSKRDDSKYWKDVTNHSMFNQKNTPSYSKYMDSIRDGSFYDDLGYNDGFKFVATGMQAYFNFDASFIDKMAFYKNNTLKLKMQSDIIYNIQEDYKAKWNRAAEKERTVYQLLKEEYYDND